ncbi:MAG: hypothetical protein HYZ81_16025, partial [Nitrospinae bacterium]|nr:hypothetical protein [Nitrospinota bacterium]
QAVDEDGRVMVWTGAADTAQQLLEVLAGRLEEARAELSAAIELYRAMEMTFWRRWGERLTMILGDCVLHAQLPSC